MINFTDMSKVYSINLSNGRELNNVHLNGNNFYTTYKIDEEMFKGGLKTVTISDGETQQVYKHMQLLQLKEYSAQYGLTPGWYFVLGEISEEERKYEKIQADIAFLSMMTNIELY